MTARRRCGAVQLASLFVTATVLVGVGCDGSDTTGNPPSAQAVPTSQFSDVQLVSQDLDGNRWTLLAQSGQGWETTGTGELRDVRGTLERPSGTIRLEAGQAEVEEMEVIRLSSGVSLRWDGYTARMARAVYRREQGRVTSSDTVDLEGRTVAVRGTGLDLDVASRTAKVLRDVSACVAGVDP